MSKEKEESTEGGLVEHAIGEMGAEKVDEYNENERQKLFDGARTVKELLGDRKMSFFPELDKVKFDDLQGKEFLVVKAMIVPDWSGRYGTSDFPLLMIQMENGKRYTTAGSGVAILRQVQQFLKLRAFPVKVKLGKEISEGTGNPYNLFI